MYGALELINALLALVSLSLISPNSVLTGQRSKIEKQSFHLIRDQDELTQLWRTHLGWPKKGDPPPRFEIAFPNQDVVALFHGADVESDSLTVSVVSFCGHRFVFYQQRRYVAAERVITSSPYAFVILPRSDKPITIVEGIRGDFGKTERWEVRASLPQGKPK